MRPFRFRSICLALIVLTLPACGHTPVSRTLFEAVGIGKNVDALNLNPNLRYLRVTVRGRVVLMVLGYVDPSPEGNIEVWYSSEGEVIHLQNGRVVATTGLETDWRSVKSHALPGWKDVLARAPLEYTRKRDEMPGYRYGITEKVVLSAVRVPSNAKLIGMQARDYRWFEETVIAAPGGLPSARYALKVSDGVTRVVYGEQCLSADLCFSWQIWPAAQ
jgi:hypothetical protein